MTMKVVSALEDGLFGPHFDLYRKIAVGFIGAFVAWPLQGH